MQITGCLILWYEIFTPGEIHALFNDPIKLHRPYNYANCWICYVMVGNLQGW